MGSLYSDEKKASPAASGSGKSPANENTNEKRYLCKYVVKAFIISGEDTKIELDHSNILSIEYINDYETNLMAILKVSLRLDIRRKLWIIKNKSKISVKFELVKKGVDIESEETIIEEEEVWNEEFTAYFSDEHDYSDIKSLEGRLSLNDDEAPDLDETESENYYETQNQFDLYLFQTKLLKASRYSFNRVYTKNTLQNMVAEMLTDSKHEKVLMSKFENEEVYIEILIPPNPLFKCLIYLDQYYGYYEKGAMIYYDVDTLYIIKTDGKVSAKREEEWDETNFIIKTLTTSQPGNGMIRKDGEKIFYPTISENDINPQKFSDTQNVDVGSEATIVTTDDIEVDKRTTNQKLASEKINEAITLIKKGTKYTADIMQARMDENECILYISGDNFDLKAFTPNKKYRVTFDETLKQEKFGKNEYRLAYSYHYLTIESTYYMSSSHKVALKKTGGQET